MVKGNRQGSIGIGAQLSFSIFFKLISNVVLKLKLFKVKSPLGKL